VKVEVRDGIKNIIYESEEEFYEKDPLGRLLKQLNDGKTIEELLLAHLKNQQ